LSSHREKYFGIDFLRQCWILVRLRYRLIWARARTGRGSMALLFALYLLGGLFALFLSFGGFGVAIGMIENGRGESIARWMLAGLFANGIGLSLLFGLGPREAFSEQSLRRYPLNHRERFAVRHMIGVLDPTWIILIAGAFGLALGFVWLGAGSIVTGIPAVILFIVANYLATAVLLAVVEIMMETRSGSAILGSAVVLLVLLGPLAIGSLVAARSRGVLRALDYLLEVAPPGAAAAMIADNSMVGAIRGLSLLVFWCSALAITLNKLEKRPQVRETDAAASISWNDLYDRLGDLLGAKYGPLVSKSLRYHLRCNIIRFSLVTSPIIVLMGKFLFPEEGPDRFLLVSLTIFFIMSSATGAALMLNIFGYDDAGIRRYAILPIPFADALRAGSFASLILRASTVFVAYALWLMFYVREFVTWQIAVMILSIALASLFLFNALGLFTSILSPKRGDFYAMWNNRLSFGANAVIIGGIFIPFWATMIIADRISQPLFLRFWWIPSLILVLCAGFYLFSLWAIDRPLSTLRENLIKLIAGGADK
jgi:hypothetical protein